MFGKSSSFGIPAEVVITFSVLWSFKTCLSLHVKATKVEKTHLEFTSKIFLVMIALFASSARILAMISYFTPFFGLFDLLHHHKAEQIPFTLSKEGKYGPNDTLVLYNSTPVRWGQIDTWDYSDEDNPSPPSYTTYTLLSLAESFMIFWLLVLLHLLAVFFVKIIGSKKFQQADKLDKFLHCMENLNIAYPFQDFDYLSGTAEEHKDRFRKVNIEVLCTMLVNFIFHALMLIPLWYTGQKGNKFQLIHE